MDSEDVTLDRVACLEVKMQGKNKRGIGGGGNGCGLYKSILQACMKII